MTAPDVSLDTALGLLARALKFGINPSLDNITELTAALGRPQDAFTSVQITGTNGKTSTARLTAALLRGEGMRVGLFTSPHLECYAERIEVDGERVSDADFARAVVTAASTAERLRGADTLGTERGFTEFELLTAAALWIFRESGVEIAVLEVGLGGRWDATSVVTPKVAVITGVGLDHTHILGGTLEAIAAEKAAIIGPESLAVLGPGTAAVDGVLLARAREVDAPVRAVRSTGDASPLAEEDIVRFSVLERPRSLLGVTALDVSGRSRHSRVALNQPAYQAANVATAIAAAEAALGRPLDDARVAAALAALTLPGRFERVRDEPLVIVDGSHNPQAAAVLAEAVAEAFPDSAARPRVLLGILGDKDAAGIVRALMPVAREFIASAPDSPRALEPHRLAEIVEHETGLRPREYPTVRAALEALLGEGEAVLVTGSLVTAGEGRGFVLHGSETRDG